MTYTSNFCANNKSPLPGESRRGWLRPESRRLKAVWGSMLDDLEKMARVLGVKVVELFFAPGRTAAERVVLGLLEGNGD